jgi:hypothetical protein
MAEWERYAPFLEKKQKKMISQLNRKVYNTKIAMPGQKKRRRKYLIPL